MQFSHISSSFRAFVLCALLASPTLPKSTTDTVLAILDYLHKRSGISSLEK